MISNNSGPANNVMVISIALALADCFCASTVSKYSATIVTYDPEFKKPEEKSRSCVISFSSTGKDW